MEETLSFEYLFVILLFLYYNRNTLGGGGISLDILAIYKKCRQLTKQHFFRILNIYLFVELLLFIINMIPNQLVSIILGIAVVTISHAYVVTSLKIVENHADEITFKDAFVGIREFARLFPSYIMRKVSLNFLGFVILLPAVLMIRFKTGFAIGEFLDWVRMIVVSGMDDLTGLSTVQNYLTSLPMVLSVIVSSVLTTVFSYGLAMVPYLVQKYEISWNEAMIKSWKMMKGHKRQLLILRFMFLPRMMFIYLLIIAFVDFFSFSTIISVMGSVVLSIYLPILLYQPQFEIANALFFQQLISQEKNQDLFKL